MVFFGASIVEWGDGLVGVVVDSDLASSEVFSSRENVAIEEKIACLVSGDGLGVEVDAGECLKFEFEFKIIITKTSPLLEEFHRSAEVSFAESLLTEAVGEAMLADVMQSLLYFLSDI